MSLDLNLLRERYIRERPLYARLAAKVETLCQASCRQDGTPCHLSARPKEVASFLKKALRKPYSSPYDDIHDKAGVRVVVAYADLVPKVDALIGELFEVRLREDKRQGLAFDQLGYLGIHYEVVLCPETTVAEDQDLSGLLCEIQLHAPGEGLWAETSHDLLYKTPVDPSPEVKRAVYRLVALAELFDAEVGRAREAVLNQPGYSAGRLIDQLEQHFYRLTAPASIDGELSRFMVEALQPLYTAGEPTHLIDTFVGANETKLEELFRAYLGDERCSLLLFQPEVLMIFERLAQDPFQLAQTWTEHLPIALLEELASVWGVPI